jgi:hypothetical protein
LGIKNWPVWDELIEVEESSWWELEYDRCPDADDADEGMKRPTNVRGGGGGVLEREGSGGLRRPREAVAWSPEQDVAAVAWTGCCDGGVGRRWTGKVRGGGPRNGRRNDGGVHIRRRSKEAVAVSCAATSLAKPSAVQWSVDLLLGDLLGYQCNWPENILAGPWKLRGGYKKFRPTPKAMARVALGPAPPLARWAFVGDQVGQRCIFVSENTQSNYHTTARHINLRTLTIIIKYGLTTNLIS